MPKAKLVTDINNTYFTNNKVTVGTSAPTTGTYVAGDMVISSSANSNAFGWICTASGTPGSWKVLKSGVDVTNINWNNIIGRPGTYPPDIGNTSTTAFRGDHGAVAYNHSQQLHAPANAQRNADITQNEIEAKLNGCITSHNHDLMYISKGYSDVIDDVGAGLRIYSGFFNGENVKNGMPGGSPWKYYINLSHYDQYSQYTGTIGMDFGGDVLGFKVVRADREQDWKYIYHTGNKPTANDVGALSLSGGTVSGETIFNSYLSVNAWSGYGSGRAQLWYNGDARELVIQPGSANNIRVNNNLVYHTGNRPTANDVGALPITGGDISGNVTASAWRLNIHGGNCYVGNGNGDAATYDEHNMIIRSWHGIGFRNHQDVCKAVLDTRTGSFSTKGHVLADSHVQSGKFVVNGVGEWGANYICGGNGDAANYDYHNIVIRSWYGIGFRDYQNICRLVINARTGGIMSQGTIHANGYLSSSNLYLDDIRIRPYSANGVSIIKPGGAEFAGLEVKELWLGPHSEATRCLTMSPSAPSSPMHGDVWIQNG